MIVRQERPDDERELAALIDAAFGDTETSRFTWMALPLSSWAQAVAAPFVYPGFFPPPDA